jgi:4-carboxymuconolactone decarboxylase
MGRIIMAQTPAEKTPIAARASGQERRARGLDVLRTLRNTEAPQRDGEALERENGTLGGFVVDFALGDVWSRPGLSRRDRSLITVTVLTCLSQERQLRAHVNGALNHGLSPEEIREIVTHLCGYCGFPRALNGMAVVNAVLAERGIDAPMTPAATKDDAQRLREGADVAKTLMGAQLPADGEATRAAMIERLGPTGEAAALFILGDVWARSELSRRDRSMLVVSALTALGRIDELEIHIPGALNHGVTKAEIEELMLMLAVYAGFPFAVEGMRCLRHVADKAPAMP